MPCISPNATDFAKKFASDLHFSSAALARTEKSEGIFKTPFQLSN